MKEALFILIIAALSGYGCHIMRILDCFLKQNKKETDLLTEGLEKNEAA